MKQEKFGFLACDVSKGYGDFIILDSNENVLEPAFKLNDTAEGRLKLKELIDGLLTDKIDRLFCGVESTGGYENNWYHMLSQLSKACQVHVSRLNPRAVKCISGALQRRTITDEVSSQNIVLYMIHFPGKIKYTTDKSIGNETEYSEGRKVMNMINMFNKQKVQLSNQLEKLLYSHFSVLLSYCRHGIPNWILELLIKYPTEDLMVKAGKEKLAKIKGLSIDKAESILKKISNSSAQYISSKITQHLLITTAKELLLKERLVMAEKKIFSNQYKDNETVKLLTTIPGIGVESAVTIHLEIENIERFDSAKKLSSYFGINPIFKQSGDNKWAAHMSKKGRSEIRKVLYMSSLSGIRFNPILKAIYSKFRSKGLNHYQSMGVVMHKLLRIIYGILKTKQPFDVKVDIQNTLKAKEKQNENKEATQVVKKIQKINQNRFINSTDIAPISRKHFQKIKKASIVPIQTVLESTGSLDAATNI